MAQVTFLQQAAPVDEYGRALYAVARSIIRALIKLVMMIWLTSIALRITRSRPHSAFRNNLKNTRLPRFRTSKAA